jgi:hypothetical protein
MLVSGEGFQDISLDIKEVVDFIRVTVPNYFLKFCTIEALEMETDLFDQERLLDEIDYGILGRYIKENNLLEV